MGYVAYQASYWSSSPGASYSYHSHSLRFLYDGYVSSGYDNYRSYGFSLRCVQE